MTAEAPSPLNAYVDLKEQRDQIISDMKVSYGRGELLPFVGAGFSCNISKEVSFDSFVARLSKAIQQALPKDYRSPDFDLATAFSGHANEAMEFFVWCWGRYDARNGSRAMQYEKGWLKLQTAISQHFDDCSDFLKIVGNEPAWIQHRILVSLFSEIFTTNWDHTIEEMCRHLAEHEDVNLTYKTYRSQSDGKLHPPYEHVKDDKRLVQVYKYHGDLDDTDSMIATEQDYYARLARIKDDAMDNLLRDRLREYDLMMLGYSLSDINVKYHLHQINLLNSLPRSPGEDSRPKTCYWILLDDPVGGHVVSRHRRAFLAKCRSIEVCYLFAGAKYDPNMKQSMIIELLNGLKNEEIL